MIELMEFLKFAWSHRVTFAFGLLFLLVIGGFSLAKHEMHEAQIAQDALKASRAQTKLCQESKQITMDVGNALQLDLNNLDTTSSLFLHSDPGCVLPATRPASGHDAAGDFESLGRHGVSTQWLLEYAKRARTCQVKLKACQSLIIKERKANHQ